MDCLPLRAYRLLLMMVLCSIVPSCAHQRELVYPHRAGSRFQGRSGPDVRIVTPQPEAPPATQGHKPLLNVID